MASENIFMSSKENYEELLHRARKMTVRNIRIALKQRGAFHRWAIDAYEKALEEKGRGINGFA